MKRVTWWMSALLGAWVAPLAAQVDGHLDLGMGGAALPAVGMTSLWAVAPELRWQPAHFRFEGSGEYRDFGTAGRSYSGAATASWFASLGRPLLLELNGAGEGRQDPGRPGATTWDAGARVHLQSASTGGWLGLRAGQDRLGSLNRWEAGLWRTMGRVSLQVQGRRTAGGVLSGSSFAPTADSLARFDTTTQTRVRITTDLGAWLSWNGGRLQLRGGMGWRIGQAEPVTGSLADQSPAGVGGRYNWWSAEGTYWLSDQVGLTGAVGNQPPNPSLFVAGQHYMRLSIRVALNQRHTRNDLEPMPVQTEFSFRRRGELVEFSVRAPLATRVELMADCTDWQPVDLVRQSDGAWRARIAVTPGIHYFNLRFDGGNWQPPATTRIIRDEFGKETGVVLIE